MAKKQQNNAELIDCKQCVFGCEALNYMIVCNNKERNPHGFKIGCWLRPCKYFNKKK